jgi:tRNA modification GTPase
LKEGLRVTLVGRPNVGKSSLFNSLISYDRAIVTEIPGTTRDTISEVINIDGVPVLITDTAGVRASADRIEQLGIERTRRAVTDADLTVVVLDGSQTLTEDRKIFEEASDNHLLIAVNKSDLEDFSLHNARSLANGLPIISISAKNGGGLNDLRAAIMEPFSTQQAFENSFVITSARHYDLLRRASDSLRSTESLFSDSVSEEIILAKLYEALRFLGEITGETTPEDVLSEIFSSSA